VLFGAASLYFLGVALNETSRTAVRWWAVASILALATHYFGIFLAAGEAVVLMTSPRLRRATVLPAACVVVAGAALLPLALHQQHGGQADWIAQSWPLWRRVVETGGIFLVGSSAVSRTWHSWSRAQDSSSASRSPSPSPDAIDAEH
jgi:hypothetical protein